tara:strand:+ start:1303 stop:3234 length:1932 start_codon:yes stop_codon:yes gene_type:complete
MSIEINIEDLNSIDREDELTLEERLATETSRVRRKALTGDRRSPKEQITEFFGDPMGNIAKPASNLLTDVGSGAITGLSGVAQLSALTTETVKQGYLNFIGEDYTDAEKNERIAQNITDPELRRQSEYAAYRKRISNKEPSSIAGFIGEVIPTMVANPKKAAEGVFGRIVQSTLYGGLAGGMEFTEGGSNERAMNAIFAAGTGSIFSVAQQLLVKGWQVGKQAISPSLSQFVETNKINLKDKLSTEEVREVIAASRTLGINVTPAEATGDIFLTHGQNTLNVNTASREQLSEFIMKRNDAMTESIISLQKRLDDDILQPRELGTFGKIQATSQEQPKAPFIFKRDKVLWKKTKEDVYRQNLEPEELVKVINQSPILQKVHNDYQKARKKPPSKRTEADVIALENINELKRTLGIEGDLPFTNVGYLDMLIQNLDAISSRAGLPVNARVVNNQRKVLSKALKDRVPEYSSLKQQQQRAIAVSTLKNSVDDSVVTSGDYAETFYTNVLKNKKSRENMMGLLATDPLAQKKLTDLTTVMSHIYGDSSLTKLMTNEAEDLLRATSGGTFGKAGLAFNKLSALIKNDAGMINVITNPQWTFDISKLKGRTSKETLDNLTNYLSRVVSTSDKIEEAIGLRTQPKEPAIF